MPAKTQPARGMRDFLPSDLRKREYVIRVVKEVYERYGFEPLETPAVENIETLLGKYGEEGNQLIFKILKRGEHERTGEADLALRYDLTVPLARVVAEYGDKLPKFFKRYQIQPVWRADRPARGRFREFYQCDVDCIGTRSAVVEAEICAAANDVLTTLGFDNFTIRLNHRQVLAGVLGAAGIEGDKHSDALVAIDKLDKIGRDGVAREFEARGIGADAGGQLLDFFEKLPELEHAAEFVAEGGGVNAAYNRAVLGRLVEFVGGHDAGALGVENLRQIVEYAESYGVADRIKIDPSLARGLSYYTGAIMEISVPDLAGSLGGGGRYDNLVGMFSGRHIPAAGFSLGLERIIVVMKEKEKFPSNLDHNAADVMVTALGDDYLPDVLKLARELRDAGMRVTVYPQGGDKLRKQLSYASAQSINVVALIGKDEHDAGVVVVRDMLNQGQERPSRQVVVDVISAMLPEVKERRRDHERVMKNSARVTDEYSRQGSPNQEE